MCGGRVGMGVQTESGVTVGNFSLCQTYELSTYYASFGSGRFADYPIGQYLTELSGKVRLLLCIAGLCCLTGLYGHGNDHAFGKLDAGQQTECLHCTQKERTVALCQCHSDARSETVRWHWLGCST